MTRQQRRAAEREALKQRVHTQVQDSKSVQHLWRVYGAAMAQRLGCEMDDELMEPLRHAFYSGAASMFELTCRVAPDDVSEDAGVAMLQRLEDELVTFAKASR